MDKKPEKQKRRICVFNGKRGGFNALTPTMQLIDKDPALELKIVLTDMHLSEKFGNTLSEAKRWFKITETIDMEQKSDLAEDRSCALGVLKQKLPFVFKKIKPDFVLLLGDRSETLIATFTALQLGIPVAHVQGGEISGNIDGIQRHAITKLAHIHFTETEEAKKRVLRLGEEDWRVFNTGAPYVDLITSQRYTPMAEVRKKFGLDDEETFFIVLQHPVTTEPQKSCQQMKTVLKAIKKFKHRAIVVFPCSDQGYQGIVDAIEEVKEDRQFLIYKNIRADDFLGLQAVASVFIGNSSSGIYEAPYFHLPVVNIGIRQKGRERENNVIDAKENMQSIVQGIKKAISDQGFKKSLYKLNYTYGNGGACEKIIKVLKTVKIDDKLFNKKITF